MKNCENCKNTHSGIYGSGRFCNEKCARGFSTKDKRKIINEKVSLKLKGNLVNYFYNCEKCETDFIGIKKIKKGRNIHCTNCKRKVLHSIEDPKTLFDLSTRTIGKIIKRGNVKCMMCNWDKTSLDIHHIIPKKDKGTNEDDNLICLCPNCHRMAHERKYDYEELKCNSIKFLFNNWKDFYHPSN
jgi:DNA-directed RNA polymerase subunit RPC12/RpoP